MYFCATQYSGHYRQVLAPVVQSSLSLLCIMGIKKWLISGPGWLLLNLLVLPLYFTGFRFRPNSWAGLLTGFLLSGNANGWKLWHLELS